MTKQELAILLKDIIEEETFIYDTFEDETYIYVLTKLKILEGIDFDDRYGTVGGLGPIIVNKQTKEFKRVNSLEVKLPSELYTRNHKESTLDSIAQGIVKRQYVNFNDTYEFCEIKYRGNDSSAFTFGKVIDDLKKNKEQISLHFIENEIRDQLILFLEVINVKTDIDSNGWLVIHRVPEK